MGDFYLQASKWCNENQGILSIFIFTTTISLGWFSGIFSKLRKTPKLKIRVIDGPTLCCTFPLKKKHGEFEVHRTCIALYLSVANTGSAATSIENISVGYHWNLHPFSLQWLRYSIGWFWLCNQTVSLEDFQGVIGGKIKVFPFLVQRNTLSSSTSDTYLEIGKSANGVVYFEQADSWGGCCPIVHMGRVALKVRITDVFGNKHTTKLSIPSVTVEEARKFNPSFGKTLTESRGESIPFDRDT